VTYNSINRLITLIFLLSITFTVLSALDNVSATSAIYVNDSSGNDDNNGSSWLLAKKSIKNATKTVTNGGTVNIADGLYTGVNNTKITIGKDITIKGQSRSGTVINGANNAWIFKIQKGKNVVIQSLTLANGYRSVTEHDEDSDAIYDNEGGAIFNKGILTVEDSKFVGNTASDGGAIFNWGTLTVTGSTFAGNTAGVSGGAIDVLGTSTIVDSIFTNNTAYNGGAVDKAADLTLKKCIFITNSADIGGAICNDADYGVLNMVGTIFNGNTASYGADIWTITEFDNENETSDPENTNPEVEPKVKAASKTIGMQPTGMPILGFIVAVMAVLSGLTIPKRK
jgi:autotransporter family porin